MLVITRRLNDSIVIEIGGQEQTIEIKVTEIGNQVRLGIAAPEICKIWRKELYQTVQANKRAAEDATSGNIRSLALKLAGEKESK